MWMREYQFNKLKPLSYDRLESTVVNHIFPHMGGLKFDKVTRNQIQALINGLYKKQKLSHSSVKKVYHALNACYKHAIISDVVTKNPCIGIVLPSAKEHTREISALSEDEVEKLKQELGKTTSRGEALYRYEHAYLLILHTGLRMGEALSLSWNDIDFENKTITINKNSVMTKKRDEEGNRVGGYELQTQNSVKTASGNRIIPINRSAEKALLALKKGNDTPFVIVNRHHRQIPPNNFERRFHSVLKYAGIDKKYGIHSLRHTFASMLFSKGVDIKIVSQLLGHSSVKITYDIYVHLFEKDIHQVTDVLD